MRNPAAYHNRVFYMKNLDLAPKIYMETLPLLKISASFFFFKLLPTPCATRQHTITENSTQKIWIWHPKFTYIPFYYLKSAQLCVSLNCCRHSVKPGSITCQSILHRIRIQHQTCYRKPFIATIYWNIYEISHYVEKSCFFFIFTSLPPLLLLSRHQLVLECFAFENWIWNPKSPQTSHRNRI